MRKTILILLLCAPLFVVMFLEAKRLYDVSSWSSSASSPDDGQPHPDPAELDKAKKAADAIVDLPDDVAASIIRLDAPPAAVPSSDPLESSIVEHARTRAKGREQVIQAKLKAADIEKRIQDILDGMLGPDGRPASRDPELERQLREYEKDVHSPALLARARAEAAWPELDQNHGQPLIDKLYETIDHWTPATDPKNMPEPAEFEAHAELYRKYLKDHEAATGKVPRMLNEEARQRLALLEKGAKLVAVLGEPAGDRLKQLGELVQLDDGYPASRLRKSLQRLVRVVCDDVLKVEPYDENVIVTSANAPEPRTVKRKDVKVNMKNGDTLDLTKPGENEYTIPAGQITTIYLLSTREDFEPGVPPLKGTLYSDAIRAFNTARDKIKDYSGQEKIKDWTEKDIVSLQETCVPHEADLKKGTGANLGGQTLIERINKLLEIVRSHRSLFITKAE